MNGTCKMCGGDELALTDDEDGDIAYCLECGALQYVTWDQWA